LFSKMKNLFFLIGCIALLSGCDVSLKVIDKREPTLPYKKVLVMYLNEGCDFTVFDSLSYDICVKSCFAKAGNNLIRKNAESLVTEELTTAGTTVLNSSDLPDDTFGSYAAFQQLLDSNSIDAVLLIDFRDYKHVAHPILSPTTPRSMNTPAFNTPSKTYSKLKAGFDCYLLPSKSLYFPVWYAEQEVEGRRSAEEKGLKKDMAAKIANGLKKGGYIAH
jgi:hypothetical protein